MATANFQKRKKKNKKNSSINELLFPAAMWLSSRLLIWVFMLGIAPLLEVTATGTEANFGLGVFDGIDSIHYRNIATTGYEYINDGEIYSFTFFPLFPLAIRCLMKLGLSFELAGVLVSNLAFLGAVYCVYFWVKSYYSQKEARWATAVLTWCPLSIFSSAIYPEGLYLLLTAATMQAFDKNRYALTAFFGALSTATNPIGLALTLALVIASWKQRKTSISYIAALATATGVILYFLYCAFKLSQPLDFFTAQKAWLNSIGFDWGHWLKTTIQITIGIANWESRSITEPIQPSLFALIIILGYLLLRFRKKLEKAKIDYGFAALILIWLLVAGEPLINTFSVIGSAYLIWKLRKELSPATATYGLCGLGLILASGNAWFLSRIVYGIVSVSIALGILLSRHPRWGYLTMGLFAISLATYSIRFAQNLLVG